MSKTQASVLRVAIVGLGHIGRVYIAALKASERFDIKYLCDQDISLNSVAPELPYDIKPENVFSRSDIDVVVIATPNQSHFGLAKKALEKGHNLILEKPAASSMVEIQAIEQKAVENESHVFYAFHSAQAMDVQWFRNFYRDHKEMFGTITAFQCNFYDPYIQNGKLVNQATCLENPWRDSGVNALSVLSQFMDVSLLKPIDLFSAGFEHTDCTIRQMLVQYAFPTKGNNIAGLGHIDTNWGLNLDLKQTRFSFGETGYQVLLDHTGQKVIIFDPLGGQRVAVDFSSTGERLINQYINLFDQYYSCRSLSQYNGEQAMKVHAMLFASENT